MKAVSKFFKRNLHWFVVGGVTLLTILLFSFGHLSENGQYITFDGKDAQIPESVVEFVEDAKTAMARIMNVDAPTDEATIEANDEPMGQGFYVDIDTILARILPDGDTDNGLKWQCSKYTGYLATGKREYSTAHTDYGPVNGKDVAAWLVNNYGFKYIDQPVKGAIGSGGFNTAYGHTAVYLYATGSNTAMVNDANYTPLTVSTHNMNIDGWVWVVPGNYEPTPTPTPDPTPTVEGEYTYTYVYGDTFGQVLVNLGLDEGNLWGDGGTVKKYGKQLIEQNMLDANGNVKVGVPFVLER